jgi:hypothetical protein
MSNLLLLHFTADEAIWYEQCECTFDLIKIEATIIQIEFFFIYLISIVVFTKSFIDEEIIIIIIIIVVILSARSFGYWRSDL